ncbi:hypothetical protein C2S51_005325 [Perilla frutescens var. frutescens]|nr:hypothetical protein C2S51_005325 [Perilla frutescens var. frutescens]
MAAVYGNKENIPSSSSVKAGVAFSKVSSNKKRKITMPLSDITNLHYPEPGCPPLSLLLLAVLAYQLQNRRKRADASAFRDPSASAAATLRKHFR